MLRAVVVFAGCWLSGRLLAAALRPKEIAQRLYISPATVRNHISRIYTKLDVHNVVELVRRVQAGCAMPRLVTTDSTGMH